MAFAENTSVSVEKSQAEIKKILSRYGATKTATAEDMDTGSACIQFVANDRLIKFVLTLPTKMEKRFIQDGRGKTRSIPAIEAVWEQACRQKWRALCLCIKAKLEAVESGISEFEDEFLAHIVLPSGQTVGETIRPHMAEAYLTKEPMRGIAGLLGVKP